MEAGMQVCACHIPGFTRAAGQLQASQCGEVVRICARISDPRSTTVRKASRSDPLICKIDATGFAAVMLALTYMFWGPIIPDVPRIVAVDLPVALNSRVMPRAVSEDALFI